MKMKILTQEDWKIWKSFRLEALKNSPESFGSSYEEELKLVKFRFSKWLNQK